jgi:hypothetical protein
MRVFHLLLLATAFLCGCASYPKQVTGQFTADKGDFVVIKGDGSLYWSPPSKAHDRVVFVGILVAEKDPHVFRVVVPSAARINPVLKFNDDHSRVTMDWQPSIVRQPILQERSTEFARVPRK